MIWKIKNIYNEVMHEVEAETFLKAVENKYANLRGANLRDANLTGADLRGANLRCANLRGANLRCANLTDANLRGANLRCADLRGANLRCADLTGADLTGADLTGANLTGANLTGADLSRANLSRANLSRADLKDTKLLVKIMGVIPGNCYYKRFDKGLKNNNYQFYVGLNMLMEGEVFASDERVTCSYPGFHFASKSWCAVNYPDRPLEALIRIPLDAQINEPWTTDGKSSADKIEILQIWDTKTGEDVTWQYQRPVKKTKKVSK